MQNFMARVAFLCASLVAGSFGIASADTQATPAPAPTATPTPFTYNGFVRGYYFTRQNASSLTPAARSAVNQATYNTAVDLHGSYAFPSSAFSVGATYLYADPFNNCTTPQSHLSPPCGKHPASLPGTNPDDTLPGFELNTLYEAYLQYKTPDAFARIGNQVINTPWANASDSRLKPVAFQGAALSYKFDPQWTGELMYMNRFEDRVESAFDNSTLLTSHPADAPGVASNIYTPGGGPITTSGFGYARLGYTGKNNVTADLDYYAFANIANFVWADGKYTWKSPIKPFVALQLGSEKSSGAAVIGTIDSEVYGIQGGVSVSPNVDLTIGYDGVPQKSTTVTLPAGVTCASTKNQISVKAGTTFPYYLPSGGTTNCFNNGNGTATIYYGGLASPYTDSYATDPLFTTSISQGMADRRSPGDSVKFAATFTSNNKRFKALVSRALYSYGNGTSGVSPTQETDLDGQYFFNKVGKGPYKGFSFRERYAERTQAYTASFGGTPLFKYNRTQLEYDF